MAAWNTRMGSMQRTGRVHDSLTPPLTLRWTAGIPGHYLWNSPTVSEDGIVYMCLWTEESDRQYCLHALRLDTGSVLWHQPAIRVAATGAATIHHRVVFVCDAESINCVDRHTGSVVWQYRVPKLIRECATAVWGNLVYVGAADGHLYTLDATTGELVWQFTTDTWITFTPSVANDTVYVGLTNSKQPEALVALNARTGELQWKHEFAYGISFGYNSTVAVHNGLVFAALQRYGLCAFAAASGQLVWRYELDYGPWTAPCIADDVVYVAGWGLHAVDASCGSQLWATESYSLQTSAPIVTDAYVFIGGGYASKIYAFDRRNGHIRWQFEMGGHIVSTPAIADHTLLVGCHDGYLYCLEQTAGRAAHL